MTPDEGARANPPSENLPKIWSAYTRPHGPPARALSFAIVRSAIKRPSNA